MPATRAGAQVRIGHTQRDHLDWLMQGVPARERERETAAARGYVYALL